MNTLKKVSDYIVHHAAQSPETEALKLGDLRYSYSELESLVDQCAYALLDAGIKKGDRIATLSTPHPEFIVTFLAASSIGAIWIGLNPKYQLKEYQYVIADAQPSLLFARTLIGERDFNSDLKPLMAENDCLKSLVILNGDPATANSVAFKEFIGSRLPPEASKKLESARELVEPDDPAMIIYTSGTTGNPKGALIPHRGLVKVAHVQLQYWNPIPLRVLNFLPINHIGCVGDIACYTLVGGGSIVFMEQFDPKECMHLTQQEKITFWGAVPTVFQLCLSLPELEEYDLSSVQLIVWGGANAPADLIHKLKTICPKLSTSYGQTETVGSVTFIPPCDDLDVLTSTVGRPVPEYGFRIVDAEGRIVEQGEKGEIQVRGDFIMLGYWRNPESTAATIKDGWLHTGDLAIQDKDGYVRLVGRLKEMFISGGYNVFPLEIEQVLESHPAVAMAAVVSAPDELFSEVGHAWILHEPEATITDIEIRKFCKQHLANYKVPKRFFIRDQLPMLPIGKLDRRELKDRSAKK